MSRTTSLRLKPVGAAALPFHNREIAETGSLQLD